MNSILLQAAAAPANGTGTYSTLIMLVLIFVVFYFFMIRPQMKKQKEIKKFRDSIKEGDKVITAGGIYGKVKSVKPDTIILEIADGVKITIDKGSVYASAADTAADASNAVTAEKK
ncbi:MAG: preprotein translocase subunit YajC [Paludibacteraceae bacterium]|nr:preprotein translocase subunit YajC [Paludibacteraceae bacterium]